MDKSLNITDKMVLGTAQFGMDYGIANVSGKPTRKEVFGILDLAWAKGVRCFDTAPGYGSESILGEYITSNGLGKDVKVLTKINSLGEISDYENSIRTSLASSLKKLKSPIDVLFFHDPVDSVLLQNKPYFFEKILKEYPVSSLGVSVYETQEVEKLNKCELNLAFQFPFNYLDRRFELISMPEGKRYARSIFLQGLLLSKKGLRQNVPKPLQNLRIKCMERLVELSLQPVTLAVSFVVQNESLDYFLFGVDSKKQLCEILNLDLYNLQQLDKMEVLDLKIENRWLDPRNWE